EGRLAAAPCDRSPAAPVPTIESAGERADAVVRGDRHRRGRNRSGEDQAVVDHRYAAKDVDAEAPGADRGGNGCHPDGDHRGNAYPGENDAECERQLDLPELLTSIH